MNGQGSASQCTGSPPAQYEQHHHEPWEHLFQMSSTRLAVRETEPRQAYKRYGPVSGSPNTPSGGPDPDSSPEASPYTSSSSDDSPSPAMENDRFSPEPGAGVPPFSSTHPFSSEGCTVGPHISPSPSSPAFQSSAPVRAPRRGPARGPFPRVSRTGHPHSVTPSSASPGFRCTFISDNHEPCKLQHMVFQLPSKIRDHLINEHMKFSPFQCENCKQVYTRLSLYTRHKKETRESKQRSCPNEPLEGDEHYKIRMLVKDALWSIQLQQSQVNKAIALIQLYNNQLEPRRKRARIADNAQPRPDQPRPPQPSGQPLQPPATQTYGAPATQQPLGYHPQWLSQPQSTYDNYEPVRQQQPYHPQSALSAPSITREESSFQHQNQNLHSLSRSCPTHHHLVQLQGFSEDEEEDEDENGEAYSNGEEEVGGGVGEEFHRRRYHHGNH